MKRCLPPSSHPSPRRQWLAACLLAPLLATSAAQAQHATRTFPPKALRGVLVVAQPPDVVLDGQPARLSPGARIRGANNMLVLSGAIVNQTLTVNYTLETLGLVHEVWILTEDEAKEKRPTAADLRD